jgi:hypothetical protein
MLKRISAIAVAGGATVALLAGATPSFATTAAKTYTVKPGGAAKASGTAQVKDTKTGTIAKCTSLKLSATLKKGSGLAGAKLGKITTGSFTGCKIGTIAVTVKTNGFPWYLNATSYASGVTTGTITGIDLVATATGCSATLDGTAAGADNGTVKVKYTNSTGKLTILSTGGNLHDWGVVGCLGLENNGDPQDASGTTTVTPKQTITSP